MTCHLRRWRHERVEKKDERVVCDGGEGDVMVEGGHGESDPRRRWYDLHVDLVTGDD